MALNRRPYPITELTGGLNVGKDPLYIQNSESSNIELARYHKGVVGKDFALSNFSNVAERVMGFHKYQKYNANSYTVCLSSNKAYKYDAGNFTAISGNNSVFTANEDNSYSIVTFDDLFIVTNGKDAIQTWDGANWANLGGSPPSAAKWLTAFYSRLILAHTYESNTWYPSRVRWSIVGDPANWTGTGSGAIDILDSQDRITGIARLADRVFVFKEDSIWELYYVGGTDYFKVRLVSADIGCRAGKTIVNVGTTLIFLGTNNIYVFDGSSFVPIGDKLFPMLYNTIDASVSQSYIGRSHAIYDYEADQYILVLPTTTNAEPNLILKYHVSSKVWTKRTAECSALGYLIRGVGSLVSWTGANGTWANDAWDIPWVSDALGLPLVVYGKANGTVLQDDKRTVTSETMTWETKDFVFGHEHRIYEVRFLCKGSNFNSYVSYDQGASWEGPYEVAPSNSVFKDIKVSLNKTASSLRVKVEAANTVEIKWVEPWYIPRSRAEEAF